LWQHHKTSTQGPGRDLLPSGDLPGASSVLVTKLFLPWGSKACVLCVLEGSVPSIFCHFLIEVKFTQCKNNCFRVYSSVAISTCTSVPNIFILPKGDPVPTKESPFLVTAIFFLSPRICTLWGFHMHKWNHATCDLLCLNGLSLRFECPATSACWWD
jgi:hypothetical protein